MISIELGYVDIACHGKYICTEGVYRFVCLSSVANKALQLGWSNIRRTKKLRKTERIIVKQERRTWNLCSTDHLCDMHIFCDILCYYTLELLLIDWGS